MSLWIRTPLIPDATATEDNLRDIGRLLHGDYEDVVERWELCTFNNACMTKYRKMGKHWPYESYRLLRQDNVQKLRDAALSTGFSSDRLFVSGLMAGSGAGQS